MLKTIDPETKALQIEREARTCLDQLAHKPIEASIMQFILNQQLNDLSKNPELFQQVGKQLERLGTDSFSLLPNVRINANNGSIDSIVFYSSNLDSGDNKTHVLEYQPTTERLNFVRIF
ncbi:MAG: hypothetical protein P4L53_05705 [Candidatus Obscuribacterales bacterium]|nr:hypothetical protein [Candidatus Obscuribacterales bacterium]